MFSCTAEVRSVNFLQEQHSIYADTEKKKIHHQSSTSKDCHFQLLPVSASQESSKDPALCAVLVLLSGTKGAALCEFPWAAAKGVPGLAVGLCRPSRPGGPPLGPQVSLRAVPRGTHHWIQSLQSGVRVVFLLSTLSLLLRPLRHVFVLGVAVFICRAFSVCD